MNLIKKEVTARLQPLINLKYKTQVPKFYKEQVSLWGVPVPLVRKISAQCFGQVKNLPLEDLFDIAASFFETDKLEMFTVAFDWVYRQRKYYREKDFVVFEQWLSKYIKCWSTCDDFCCHALGFFIYQFPAKMQELQKLAYSNNLWQRRAAAVSLIYSLRRQKYFKECFLMAESLLQDKEDLVQKGYGWMLKEASKNYPEEVLAFVRTKQLSMPRTALRYALERYPVKVKQEFQAKQKIEKIFSLCYNTHWLVN